MRRECIQAVVQAIGRELTQGEAEDIEGRIVRNARSLAVKDPAAWSAKSAPQRLQEAGQRAAVEIVHEAKLKAEREALQIAANSRVEQRLADLAAKGMDALDALDRMTVFHGDQKSRGTSIEYNSKAVKADLLRELIPVMEASNPKWFGLLENRAGVEAIIKELHGEDSGNPVAKAGAKIWKDVTDRARERFNAAGGDIGKIEDWGMPHHHSQVRVARAGQEEWLKTLPSGERAKAVLRDHPPPADWARDRWVQDVLPKLKREKYVDENGKRMDDQQLTEFLREAWTTIATGGANKNEPGQYRGNGMRANRGNATRQIHFKDAQSYIDYQKSYGEKSLYDVMTGHVEGIAKDIGLVETMGPNPDSAMKFFRDRAVQQLKHETPAHLGKINQRALRSESYYNEIAGKTMPVASERLAKTFDTLRNFLTGARLGGAAIASIPDEGTLHMTARINNLPEMRLLANEFAAFNPVNRMEERMAMRAGLALNTFISSLNRFGSDGFGQSFSRKLANSVLRVSGLNAMTEARRRAYGVTAMHAMGAVAREHASLSKVGADDAKILASKGVTDEHFNMWKAAELEDWGSGNDTMLTPDSIYRIPDEKVDQVIGGKIAKVKQEAQDHVDDLKARDVEDKRWVADRAAKLSSWLAKARAEVDRRIGKADAATQAALKDASARISRLQETIDATAESWKNPPDRNTPGIDNRQDVGFYGKAALRQKGVDEGTARERIRRVQSEITSLNQALKGTKTAELEGLFSKFNDRRAELDEFTKGSNERIAKRAMVIDRINRELDPAIARMRTQAREQAATKLLASILEETDMAVVEPGAKEHAFMRTGIQRGTWRGELTKSFFLFKSFPLSMLMRHWSRGLAQATPAQRATYIATLVVTTTVLGMMAMQAREVLAGRDPRNMNPFAEHGVKNWLKAMLQGGSLGIYGDFLFSESTQHGGSPVASFLGPVVGLGEDAFKLTQGNLIQAASGQETYAGAEALKFLQNNLPGGNLWYSKAFMDHLIWQQAAEYLSPGYLRQMRRRAEREFGQEYYWAPGEPVPYRAPDLGAAVAAGK